MWSIESLVWNWHVLCTGETGSRLPSEFGSFSCCFCWDLDPKGTPERLNLTREMWQLTTIRSVTRFLCSTRWNTAKRYWRSGDWNRLQVVPQRTAVCRHCRSRRKRLRPNDIPFQPTSMAEIEFVRTGP